MKTGFQLLRSFSRRARLRRSSMIQTLRASWKVFGRRCSKMKLQVLGVARSGSKRTSLCTGTDMGGTIEPWTNQMQPTGEPCLIGGLPFDVALQCLARVPRENHCQLRAVCKSWRWVVESEGYLELRSQLGCTEDWLYLHVGASPHLDERAEGKRTKWELAGGFSSWHALDPYRYKWHGLPPVPYDHSLTGGQVVLGATSAVLNGNLYVIGGAPFGKSAIRDVWVYNLIRNKWKKVASMLTPRFGCLAGVIKGKLYVVGGSGMCHLRGYSLPSLEIYDPERNSWCFAASARGAITTHPGNPIKYVAVIEDRLCIIGPQNLSGELNGGIYDPETDSWSELLPGLRSGWGKPSTVMDNNLYTIELGCYQCYISEEDSWSTVKCNTVGSLLEWDPRLVSALAGSNGKLYIVGTLGPALIVIVAPVDEGMISQNVTWRTMKLPNGVNFLGDLGHCSCQVISF
ncbi:hypothetical protein O6H91_11G034200 [Diphasiastrum complanatum]|uniref:Uncharacterized protein n=2 Tax=Diphasiastrum complanatum TaxID=34168 RepID=A0ACC2C803_DIPCM|nr:hypothetical protein O6H91_Y412200 [Diphasiastrum complanatum]KAJ7278605.1 hypothetical protein O6H91_Y382000 [Diphasiastrum complanatum]KAJ7538105.1 hypothetical protein O6H91_11G034200 [Diphasiastrum complanatum]KAJ7538106.1 hypothetical protein O6H91_11G034200 [Diphasiastrum complanatum]